MDAYSVLDEFFSFAFSHHSLVRGEDYNGPQRLAVIVTTFGFCFHVGRETLSHCLI